MVNPQLSQTNQTGQRQGRQQNLLLASMLSCLWEYLNAIQQCTPLGRQTAHLALLGGEHEILVRLLLAALEPETALQLCALGGFRVYRENEGKQRWPSKNTKIMRIRRRFFGKLFFCSFDL